MPNLQQNNKALIFFLFLVLGLAMTAWAPSALTTTKMTPRLAFAAPNDDSSNSLDGTGCDINNELCDNNATNSTSTDGSNSSTSTATSCESDSTDSSCDNDDSNSDNTTDNNSDASGSDSTTDNICDDVSNSDSASCDNSLQ